VGQLVGVHRALGAGGHERLVELGRQVGAQGPLAVGVDTDPVALQAVGAGAVALVDPDADPGPLEALGQA